MITLAACLAFSTAHAQGEAPVVSVLQADADGVSLRVQAPAAMPALVPGAATYVSLSAPQTAQMAQPGAPALPYVIASLAIPGQGAAAAQVTSATCEPIPGRWRLEPSPAWSLTANGPDFMQQVADQGWQWQQTLREDPAIYDSPSPFPPNLVELGDPQTMRGVRLVQVRVYPWQTTPLSGALRFCRTIEIHVSFSQPPAAAPGPALDASPFDALLAEHVLNWPVASAWPPAPPPDSLAPAPDLPWQTGVRITVAAAGLQRLTYADLAGLSVPVDALDPATLRLFYRGQEISIQVAGEDDGEFDPGDEIRFYAPPQRSRYGLVSVYWLYWGGASGLRMGLRNAAPSGSTPETTTFTRTLRLEQQTVYLGTAFVDKDEDHWFYDDVFVYPGHTTDIGSYPFSAPGSANVPGVTVTGRVWGGQTEGLPDHWWMSLWLNGQPFTSSGYAWSGYGPATIYTASVTFPAAVVSTTNTITLEASLAQVSGLSAYWINPDWFDVTYRALLRATADRLDIQQALPGLQTFVAGGFSSPAVLAYDVSDPWHPVRLDGLVSSQQDTEFTQRFEAEGVHFLLSESAALLAPQSLALVTTPDLRSASLGADYLMIGPADFLAAAQPLLNVHSAEGLRVLTVDIQDIFDQFAGGHREPQAIRDFLTYAYFFWQRPAPTYVALLGDGQYDFRNDTGRNLPNPVPPYLAPIDPYIIETVTDNALVSVSGPGDILPDMAIGRLPANTVQEVQDMVAKILAYQAAPAGNWQREIAYVADNQPDPGGGGNFHNISNEIRFNWLTADMTAQPIYTLAPGYPNYTAVRAANLAALGDGQMVMHWFGHGSKFRWGYSGTPRPLGVLDQSALPVRADLPLFLEWGCWTGYFILIEPPTSAWPNYSFGEMLMKTPGKGGIADISATGAHTAPPLQIMAHGMHQAIFTQRLTRVGVAYTAMKLFFFANAGYALDVLDTTVLFGDPAMLLRLPQGDLSTSSAQVSAPQITPGQGLTLTVTLTNSSMFTLTNPRVAAAYPQDLMTVLDANGGAVGSGLIGWTLSNLAPGASRSISAGLAAAAVITPGLYLLNFPVAVGSSMAPTVTLAAASSLLATADLAPSSLTADRAWVASGQAVTYTLVIANAGNMTFPQTWLTATLPVSLTAPLWLTATAPTALYDAASRQVRWQGSAAPASPVTVSFSSTISPTLTACGVISLPAGLTDFWGRTLTRTVAVNLAVPDVNCNGIVNVVDVQSVAVRWGAVVGDPLYAPQYDLDANGVIDTLDVVRVAAAWQ
ncbi:MAG: C25 family cysteine peptidase [Anaerolineae bacterium]